MNKEKLIDILNGLNASDYPLKADFHMHSNYSDGLISPQEIASQAEKLGMKYISIADHNTIEAYLASNVLASSIVIPSAEFDCYYKKNIIHILGLGLDIDNKELRDMCSEDEKIRKNKIYRVQHLKKPEEVIKTIKNAGGIAVLAHPARYMFSDLETFAKPLIDLGINGIEAYYPYKGLKSLFRSVEDVRIYAFADKYNLVKTGGSDFHGRKIR